MKVTGGGGGGGVSTAGAWLPSATSMSRAASAARMFIGRF
jgi:hypothetical protein